MKLTNIKVVQETTEINGVNHKYKIVKDFRLKKHYQYNVLQNNLKTNQWNLLDSFATKGEAIEYIAELEDDSI